MAEGTGFAGGKKVEGREAAAGQILEVWARPAARDWKPQQQAQRRR